MKLVFSIAEPADAAPLAALHNAVAEEMTRRHGKGPWTLAATERGVLFGMRNSRVLLARRGENIVGALNLQAKKPWAIDISYFTPVKKAIYLTNMAVVPKLQRKGIGTMLLHEAADWVKAWPAFAIRLDAFDHEAGAGMFYAKSGFSERGRAVYRKAHLVYFELIV